MSSDTPENRLERFPAQQRDYQGSDKWHDCPFTYSIEEAEEVNRHYGWEKYRLTPGRHKAK